MDERKIIIAITSHGDRTQWLRQTIQNVADDPRISEIVIRDDGSGAEYEAKLEELERLNLFKVNVVLMENTGSSFMAKYRLMENLNQCEQGHVILLDSDNVIDKDYIDTLFKTPVWDPMVIYAPEQAGIFSYRELSGFLINNEMAGQLLRSNIRSCFEMALNTQNYFINIQTYCKFIKPDYEPFAADGIYVNRILLENGVSFNVVPGLRYQHTIHPGSTYLKKASKSIVVSNEQLRIMREW